MFEPSKLKSAKAGLPLRYETRLDLIVSKSRDTRLIELFAGMFLSNSIKYYV